MDAISVENNMACMVRFDGVENIFEHGVPRGAFLEAFGLSLDSSVSHANYDNGKNIYHIMHTDGVVEVYSAPEDFIYFDTVHKKLADIVTWFLDERNLSNRPTDLHYYDTAAHEWRITDENMTILKARDARAKRKKLLAESDWTQVSDAQLLDGTKQAWATYRQALRDVPQQAGFPDSITWPSEPV